MMNSKLPLQALCVFLVVFHAHASYDPVMKKFLEELLMDELQDPEPECMKWEDQQPDACPDLIKQDQTYCEDWGEKYCRRSCSICGPKKPQAPGPIGECKDKRNDCADVYTKYRNLHRQDPCVTYPSYSYTYCRHFCSAGKVCIGPLGRGTA